MFSFRTLCILGIVCLIFAPMVSEGTPITFTLLPTSQLTIDNNHPVPLCGMFQVEYLRLIENPFRGFREEKYSISNLSLKTTTLTFTQVDSTENCADIFNAENVFTYGGLALEIRVSDMIGCDIVKSEFYCAGASFVGNKLLGDGEKLGAPGNDLVVVILRGFDRKETRCYNLRIEAIANPHPPTLQSESEENWTNWTTIKPFYRQ